MKYGKKYMFVACAALLLGMQSCDLEEYNPAGSTRIMCTKNRLVLRPLSTRLMLFGAASFMDVKILCCC